jgi:hypothetical protein
MQAGLGFAQMGSAERTSEMQAKHSAAASVAAARASRPKSGSSVVCTELYKQGRISKEVWELNIEFGKNLDIHVYKGYLKWGLPMVSFMQQSELNSKFIASFMTPCANGVANRGGIFGKFMFKSACMLNSIIGSFLKYKDSKNPMALKITK